MPEVGNVKTRLHQMILTYTDEDRRRILDAVAWSEELHTGQKRASGEPYIIHPLNVAEILLNLRLDAPKPALTPPIASADSVRARDFGVARASCSWSGSPTGEGPGRPRWTIAPHPPRRRAP